MPPPGFLTDEVAQRFFSKLDDDTAAAVNAVDFRLKAVGTSRTRFPNYLFHDAVGSYFQGLAAASFAFFAQGLWQSPLPPLQRVAFAARHAARRAPTTATSFGISAAFHSLTRHVVTARLGRENPAISYVVAGAGTGLVQLRASPQRALKAALNGAAVHYGMQRVMAGVGASVLGYQSAKLRFKDARAAFEAEVNSRREARARVSAGQGALRRGSGARTVGLLGSARSDIQPAAAFSELKFR
jgi:hypothetical protein|eukprot:gnl/Ergobibamus_cyprinoides/92.p1 GENE.gnl/Ergobibamus_cyprinoides/92~~gnl/Ergobibamus_cyprinoides/92.p1  ORF type:complete len:242 (+),score=48.83 gnl/Ergobibamus_cyprinoides/92:116-841(+)